MDERVIEFPPVDKNIHSEQKKNPVLIYDKKFFQTPVTSVLTDMSECVCVRVCVCVCVCVWNKKQKVWLVQIDFIASAACWSCLR